MSQKIGVECFLPGLSITLEKKIGKNVIRGFTAIVGAREPLHLLIENPEVRGRPFLVAEDRSCLVRFVHRGRAIGFRAHIDHLQEKPFPVAFLRYPTDFEEVTVRKEARINCDIPAVLTPGDAEEGHESSALPFPDSGYHVAVVNLSEGGCQVALPCLGAETNIENRPPGFLSRYPEAARPEYRAESLRGALPRGRAVVLSLDSPLFDTEGLHRIEGHIRWTRPYREFMLSGIEFRAVPDALRKQIARTVEVQTTFFTQPLDLQ